MLAANGLGYNEMCDNVKEIPTVHAIAQFLMQYGLKLCALRKN